MKGKTCSGFVFLIVVTITSLSSACFAAQYWINQTVEVPAGGSYYWSGMLYEGNRLQGSFSCSGGDIKFYIIDAANYAKYSNGQAFIARYSNQAIQVPQVDFVVPNDGTWFVILDNSYSIWTSKAVTVTLSLSTNNHSITSDNTSGTDYSTWIVYGIIALIVVVAALLYENYQSQKKHQSQFIPPQA